MAHLITKVSASLGTSRERKTLQSWKSLFSRSSFASSSLALCCASCSSGCQGERRERGGREEGERRERGGGNEGEKRERGREH